MGIVDGMSRRVLVTDAEAFIGPACVARFRREGDTVVAVADPLTSRSEVADLVAAQGPFDVVVANLDVPITVADVAGHTDNVLVELFARLVHPLFWLVGEAVPQMADGDGAVVIPTSATVQRCSSHPITGYQAARAAQAAFVRGAAKECAAQGIRVNGVAPNFIENPSYFPPETVADPEFQASLRDVVPAQRLGRGEEAAAAVWWLASSDASYVVGNVLTLDGGWTLG